MFKNMLTLFLISVFAVSVLYTPMNAERAAASHLISDQQVESQRRAVLTRLVGALEGHVMLLQMVLIRRLEAQVASLQTRIGSENN